MRIMAILMGCALALSGCGDDEQADAERCPEDVMSQEIGGVYVLERSARTDQVTDGTLEAREDRVVVEYTTADGSRFRATYRVTEKRDSRDDWE